MTTQAKTSLDSSPDAAQRATGAARSRVAATDQYVHASPWQAMGIAAVTGLAVGYLLARR